MSKNRLFIFGTLAVLLVFLVACSTKTGAENGEGAVEAARPSNGGGPGQAINLTGDPAAGAQVYADNCAQCHGDQGKGGVDNPGTTDTTVPGLNPIDPTLKSTNLKTYATNIDLFIEHGSTPQGTAPTLTMAALGDNGILTPQQIADVIAYVISLNK